MWDISSCAGRLRQSQMALANRSPGEAQEMTDDFKPTPEQKLAWFGKVDCAEASRRSGEETHCPCWPADECCYCGKPPSKEEK